MSMSDTEEGLTSVTADGISGWISDFARTWAETWNTRDPEKVIAMMTEDITYSDDSWPTVMHGHADIRPWLQALWAAFPDLEFEILGAYGSPDRTAGALHWRARATHRAEFAGIPATGRPVDVDGADFHKYRNGLMYQVRGIYDNGALMRQLGIGLPAGEVR